ncbi:MAG: polysaccharide export protein [Alphaproteobacteria bacterium]|nr:polysaccharide export protein [Alphaproteobacteria bacterium]
MIKLQNMSMAKFLLLVFVSVGLMACSGGNSSQIAANGFAPTLASKVAEGGGSSKASASADKIFAANALGAGSSGAEDYKISGLDVLQVSVLGLKDFDSTVQVSTSGMISLPLIRVVKAGGKTTTQLEQEIARKLSATYLQSPQVSVFIKEYNSQRVTVDGAVMKPGIFPIQGKMSLMQAIALAEGLNRVADPTGVVVFRQINGQKQAARFDLRMVRAGKIPDVNLLAGDIVMVDESSTRTTLRDINDYLPFSGVFKYL